MWQFQSFYSCMYVPLPTKEEMYYQRTTVPLRERIVQYYNPDNGVHCHCGITGGSRSRNPVDLADTTRLGMLVGGSAPIPV